jgi:metal-sulfur cluster biosynthetic enzyme
MDDDPLRQRALAELATVVDPEVGENIVDLGLVHALEIDADRVTLTLLLTSPTCPMGNVIADDAFDALQRALPERDVFVQIDDSVFWTPGRMSAAARARLGWNDPDAGG